MNMPKVGDVVQLNYDGWAADLLMIVEEVRPWGILGVVPTPQGEAPMRIRRDEIKQVWHRALDA